MELVKVRNDARGVTVQEEGGDAPVEFEEDGKAVYRGEADELEDKKLFIAR